MDLHKLSMAASQRFSAFVVVLQFPMFYHGIISRLISLHCCLNSLRDALEFETRRCEFAVN